MSRNFKPSFFLAAVVSLGCSSPFKTTEELSPESARSLRTRLNEIDRLVSLNRLRAAIEFAEVSLIDFYDSQELRDRLAELRSIRQVWFAKAMQTVDERIQDRMPRTALVILAEIDLYGDEDMIKQADAKRQAIIMANPAIFPPPPGPQPKR
jgi:hypothetical protein